jgi:hypothetical protein
MSRAGYCEGDGSQEENWAHIRWRGQVASAFRGKRGQQFLRDLIDALDALPSKALIVNELEQDGNYCAIGAVGRQRGVDMSVLDPDDSGRVADTFNIADQMAREIVYQNDENSWRWKEQRSETPEERWQRMRDWAVSCLNKEKK